jgi:hypothetical protein
MQCTPAAVVLSFTLLIPAANAAAIFMPYEETSSFIETVNTSNDAEVNVYDYTTTNPWTASTPNSERGHEDGATSQPPRLRLSWRVIRLRPPVAHHPP